MYSTPRVSRACVTRSPMETLTQIPTMMRATHLYELVVWVVLKNRTHFQAAGHLHSIAAIHQTHLWTEA